jgi:hypothetical protein
LDSLELGVKVLPNGRIQNVGLSKNEGALKRSALFYF